MTTLAGKTVFVTGATSGIGRASAETFAREGAHLVLLCRDQMRAQALCERLSELSPTADSPELLIADMANLGQLRDVIGSYADRAEVIDVLLNNAGVVCTKRELTIDGFEMSFAVNHLAPFLLTGLLLPNIQKAAAGRIVNVSSHAHTFVRGMDFADLQSEQRYRTFTVYGQSKLANLLFTLELTTRLGNTGVTVNSLHPGAVTTGLGSQNGGMGKFLIKLLSPFFKTPEQGAQTSIYLCCSPEVAESRGQYYVNSKVAKAKPWAFDADAASRLWAVSSEMTNIDYPR